MVASIGHLLDKTMTIERPQKTQQGAGFVDSLQTIATDVPCRRAPSSANDQDFAASMQAVADHSVWADPETDVKRDDILTIEGIRYEVRAIIRPSISIYKKALAEEIQLGS